MQNEKMITRIREGGVAQGAPHAEERLRVLKEDFGFRVSEKAEYALIASCFNPHLEPADMKAFARLLDYFRIDYTLLSKEYCCGDPFYLHSIDDQHEGDLKQADELAREFLGQNITQARKLGADKLLLYCAGCDMVLNRVKDDIQEEIIWHPTLLSQYFQGGSLNLQADFYPGCHRYRREILGNTPDIHSVLEALNKIEGLEIHQLDASLCCMNPDQIDSLVALVTHSVVITPCSGCSIFIRKALTDKGDHRVYMLSEVLWAAIQGHHL